MVTVPRGFGLVCMVGLVVMVPPGVYRNGGQILLMFHINYSLWSHRCRLRCRLLMFVQSAAAVGRVDVLATGMHVSLPSGFVVALLLF